MSAELDFSRPLEKDWWVGNWRVILLAVLLIASAFALFGPAGDGGGTAEAANGTEEEIRSDGPTNLVYGIELSGGTRVRAPLVGITAEDLSIHHDDAAGIESELADELELDEIDVRVDAGEPERDDATAEVFVEDASHQELADALTAVGVDATVDDVRDGVTQDTRDTAVRVLDTKIDESGLAGGTVQQTQTSGGEYFIIVEVPGEDRDDVVELIQERGAVQIVATHPVQTENGTEQRETVVASGEDFANVDPAENPAGDAPGVPVRLTDAAAQEYADYMRDNSFVNEGIRACNYRVGENEDRENAGYCLYTVVDGEIVYAANMGEGLAPDIRDGTWEDAPQFRMTTNDMSDARNLYINLQAGSLPSPMDMDSGTVFFLDASLADDFKVFSLITGILAALSVAGMVYVRYRDVRVAVPMFATAIAEVGILLGFAAAIGLPLDLAYIAGFIAVIGTGVDDLIIIADEVLSQGQVNTRRVFKNRFRKALWVIGAAAATTIIAMSPLAVLSLGDLRGFAIITIIGVLVGVLVTRPAYGDILRMLMTDK